MFRWLPQVNVSYLIVSAGLILAAVVLWFIFKRTFFRFFAKKAVESPTSIGESAVSVIYGLIKGILIVLVVLAVLQINGINVNSMLAGLGIASAIVGLAFQDLLRDVIMGIHIVSDDFFQVDDVIQYGNVEGQVISYNIRTTKLRDIDTGNIMTICNRNITEIKKRSNLVLLNVPLSYDEDYRRVHQVLSELSDQIRVQEHVLGCEYKGTQNFADSAIIYRINLYCKPEDKWEVWRKAHALLQDALDAAGMKIPYQQLDVHTIPQ